MLYDAYKIEPITNQPLLSKTLTPKIVLNAMPIVIATHCQSIPRDAV